MTISLINRAVSALDTPSSLLPFFVKDGFDITGRTVMAQGEGGKHEAREKFIEEAGTSLFWIGGIPAVRSIVNLFVKKKIDSEIHFKRINSDGIQNYFADKLETTVSENGQNIKKTKFSPQELEGIELGGSKMAEIQKKLTNAEYVVNKSKGLYKKYHLGVTTAAVLINLAIMSVALPKLNQLWTKKIISKEVNDSNNKKHKTTADTIEFSGNNKISMKEFINKTNSNKNKKQTNSKAPSFGGISDLFKVKKLFNFTEMAEGAQLNPVNGMLLLDYGISGGRVTITPRNNNERIENVVKEGGILFFFYFAADLIKKKLCKMSDKILNKPIDLDYKVISSKDFLTKLKTPHNKEELLNFVEIEKNDSKAELKVIKMIDKELASSTKETPKGELFKNFTLQMAQKEGLIEVEFDEKLQKYVRNSKKYIETEKVIDLNKNIKNFYEKGFENINNVVNKTTIEQIISKTKKVKVAAIFANMAICCASLSFLVPKLQYMIREHRTNTKAAPGIQHYEELAKNKQI